MKPSGQKWGVGFFFFLLIAVLPGMAPGQEGLPPQGKPLNLEQCLDLALKYQPNLQASQASIEAQRSRVEQALAAYYPQVSFNANYNTATNNFFSIGGGTVGIARNNYSWTFSDIFSMGPTVNQLIYDFGRTANNVKINRENTRASEADRDTIRLNVVFNVKQAYYSVLQTLALIQVAEETLTQNQKRLDQARGFYEAGTRPKIDVTNAEVNLANVQLALIRAKNNYLVARAILNNAMGLREDLQFAIERIQEFKPQLPPLDGILQTAYARRPEILQLKARQRGQEGAIDLARSGYYPILSGNAGHLWRTNQPFNDLQWDWNLGATLTVPIFSGFSTTNQIAEARALLKNLEAQEESLRQNIRLEAEQAYLGLKEAIESIAVTEKSVSQAKENYELASGRYQVGVGQPLEITDAEVLLANSRANYINSLYNYKVAEARIDKAMGLGR